MAQSRSWSADRSGLGAGTLDRLADVLIQLAARLAPQPAVPVRDRFKALEYEGVGDVNCFIQQFYFGTAEANEWTEAVALIHLRTALEAAA